MVVPDAMKKLMATATLLFALSAIAASCGGDKEGQACTKTDDCSGGTICQPIQGRTQTYCCPTPASSSKETNCQAVAM